MRPLSCTPSGSLSNASIRVTGGKYGIWIMTSAGGTARWIAGDLESWFLKINDKDYKSAGVSGGIRMTLSHDSAGPDNCTGRNVAINDVTPTTTDRSTTSPRIS